MLSHIEAVGGFVLAAQKASRSDCKDLRDQQFEHLTATLRSMSPSMEDAATTLKALCNDVPPWSGDQVREMASVVTKVTGDTTNRTGGATESQIHKHLYNMRLLWDTNFHGLH